MDGLEAFAAAVTDLAIACDEARRAFEAWNTAWMLEEETTDG